MMDLIRVVVFICYNIKSYFINSKLTPNKFYVIFIFGLISEELLLPDRFFCKKKVLNERRTQQLNKRTRS